MLTGVGALGLVAAPILAAVFAAAGVAKLAEGAQLRSRHMQEALASLA